MQVYLPIAEISMNIFVLFGLGFGVGILSGLFGIGGGFLLTPLLIFLGVPAPVSVATQSNQISAQSLAGVIQHWRRKNVDIPMGIILLTGGLLGSSLGVIIFSALRNMGQIDLLISLLYIIFLGMLGSLMLIEGINSLRKSKKQVGSRTYHHIGHRLPLKMRFRKSGLYMSALLPLLVGFCVGLISALMGVGGGFILVPAMIYIIGMPTRVVVGTSLFQIIFTAANVTILQAVSTQTVDVVLALTLLIGGVVGVNIGAIFGARLRAEQLRILLALVVLAVAIKLALDITITPHDVYNIRFIAGVTQ
ncbi:MAG: sulfite exporter TauE/SafE family protein [Alphaproteobacteria bacterium]